MSAASLHFHNGKCYDLKHAADLIADRVRLFVRV